MELQDFLTQEECQEMIAEVCAREAKSINKRRCIQYQGPTTELAISARIWRKVQPLVKDWNPAPVACGRQITFSHYLPDQFVPKHKDAIQRYDGLRARYTLLIYLTTHSKGGETILYEPEQTIKPQAGKAVIFDIQRRHKSTPADDHKYCMGIKLMFCEN